MNRQEVQACVKRKLEDFTPEEVKHLDRMKSMFEEYNRLIDDPDLDMETIMPSIQILKWQNTNQDREI